MARPRKKAEQFEIPASYLEERESDLPDGFQEAFNHARSMNNPDKAALLYADAHYDEWDSNATKD